jgi:hypothetical protein
MAAHLEPNTRLHLSGMALHANAAHAHRPSLPAARRLSSRLNCGAFFGQEMPGVVSVCGLILGFNQQSPRSNH